MCFYLCYSELLCNFNYIFVSIVEYEDTGWKKMKKERLEEYYVCNIVYVELVLCIFEVGIEAEKENLDYKLKLQVFLNTKKIKLKNVVNLIEYGEKEFF